MDRTGKAAIRNLHSANGMLVGIDSALFAPFLCNSWKRLERFEFHQ